MEPCTLLGKTVDNTRAHESLVCPLRSFYKGPLGEYVANHSRNFLTKWRWRSAISLPVFNLLFSHVHSLKCPWRDQFLSTTGLGGTVPKHSPKAQLREAMSTSFLRPLACQSVLS